MLFFRDEEHVEAWCRSWRFERGGTLSLETGWKLAKAWFSADRRAPEWRRPEVEEAEALFRELNLTSDFWRLR
jgi:hypothetical protein